MILTCPLCHSRFLLTANAFAKGPRRVRCARCLHSWQAGRLDMPADGKNLPVDPKPLSENSVPIPEDLNLAPISEQKGFFAQKNLILYLAISAAVLLVMGGMIAGRDAIARQWPALESLYEKLGFEIYHVGDGLNIVEVRSEQRYEDGLMRLVVEGKIVNHTDQILKVPAIMAAAVGSDGGIMQSWQIDPPAARLAPAASQAFMSSIKSPQGTVVQINLNFVEPKHDTE